MMNRKNLAAIAVGLVTNDSGHELEVISFTYRRIEVDHMVGKTSYVDDWSAARN
jgi:type VI protein secretion system component Hcp